ncbi:MAG: Trk system potassium transporter TrkA [Holosporales bacterium]|jgi:trk system potassium uptake protein TrkA|nr:Trk system potassium transporter TrkA [Holosporales bacterium]
MNILILGAGQVGCNIAESLVSLENHITIIDNDDRKLAKITERLDIQPILGHAAHPNVLERAGAKKTDVLIAVTNVDEINIVSCEIAHALFAVPVKIARIRDQNYFQEEHKSFIFREDNISIDYVISPEVEISKIISQGLQIGGSSSVIDIFDDAKLINVRCTEHSPVVNTPLKLLFNLFPDLDISIVAIQRAGQTIIPHQQDVIQKNDRVYLIARKSQILEAISAFGNLEQPQKSIIIGGGGNIGKWLAVEIEKTQPALDLKIIEKSTEQIEVIANFLKKADLLLGDTCSQEILQGAGIEKCDTFIAVTNDDKTNILSALLAKYYKVKNVMVLLSDKKLFQFASSLGIDSIIDPNAITVSTILSHTKQNRIKALHSIDSCVEIVEIFVEDTSNIVGLSTTYDILIPGQIIVAALKRGDELILYPDNFTITAYDKLIIAVTKDTVYKVKKIVLDHSSY